MPDPFRLDGRTVIVTGASRGIGAEVARAVVAQGGAAVLVARS
ncbi:MAG TPA: SDR family NAD(P)-dependent oxidoreductase, partial [Vulgatibacter sp.]